MSVETSKGGRRLGSNILAFVLGAVLVAFAVFVLAVGRNPLESVPYHVVVGVTSLLFGGVLLVWFVSHWTKWIGNETINMVVGVIAAVITISAFAHEIDNPADQVVEVGSD